MSTHSGNTETGKQTLMRRRQPSLRCAICCLQMSAARPDLPVPMIPSPVIVIGAGPVGLAAALMLAHRGCQVTVYEGRSAIPPDPEDSYPIGINPRTLHCLARIDPALEAAAQQTGRMVDAWHIYGGTRKVADQPSGTVIGTTRGSVNAILHAAAAQHPRITLCFDHKLKALDLASKQLTFACRHTAEPVVVNAAAPGTRVLAADGVWSAVRTALAAADATWQVLFHRAPCIPL